MSEQSGVVLLAATPIGNAGDASPRLREALASAEVVAAEDTRRLRDLARRLEVTVTGRVVSLYEHNEDARSAELLAAVEEGSTVLVVTDAGMPAVSDPGYRLVRHAIDAGARVSALPGPSAVLTALALSGLPTDRFAFEGFLPRKAGDRARALAGLAAEARTLVFFEAPHRLLETLGAMAGAFGADRPAAVARELTKTYEEVRRGTLGELAAWEDEVRGEICVVVGGAPPTVATVADHVDEVLALAADGLRLKDAAGEVATATGLRKNDLYAAALEARAAR
ncbi:16S rRNA (cytidine(1402)-2'-O)-methyltransferase [Georgenia sp. Z1491]|uniref:16S rRNA (cytidine(1402)-2'-O)-methyltransferase n=1 Tax=Georgenia sp. Z1491 TaxID=3416707 RepID=UPI003CF6E2BB